MTLRHLQIFRTVCRTGSITEAAIKMNMTQPAVSLAVKELESFYQTKLFERRNRRIYLTEPGQELLPYAETILSQFEESVDILRREELPGSCRLGVNVTAAETRLTGLLLRIQERFPGLKLTVQVGNSDIIEKMLAQNEIDFAIIDRLPGESSWITHLLYTEPMSIVSGSSCPFASLTVAELSRAQLLLREKGSGSRAVIDAVFSRHGCQYIPFAESTSSSALIRMAEAGLGLAILSRDLVKEDVHDGRLTEISLTDDTFLRRYYLIWHRNKYLTRTADAVAALIQEQLGT